MLQEMWSIFIEKQDFFLNLLWEHLKISLLAIIIAILIGGLVGVLISEFKKSAKPTLGIINFLYIFNFHDKGKDSCCNVLGSFGIIYCYCNSLYSEKIF